MPRRVFFSFHYSRDNWRVGQVRNSWLTKRDSGASTFLDKAEWEAIERRGKAAIQAWIDRQLHGTSVTAVLIGRETASREWVQYEIRKSYEDGKGLLGIYIHNLQDQRGNTDTKGANPFDGVRVLINGISQPLSNYCRTYDWVFHDGYRNLPAWIDYAAREAGR